MATVSCAHQSLTPDEHQRLRRLPAPSVHLSCPGKLQVNPAGARAAAPGDGSHDEAVEEAIAEAANITHARPEAAAATMGTSAHLNPPAGAVPVSRQHFRETGQGSGIVQGLRLVRAPSEGIMSATHLAAMLRAEKGTNFSAGCCTRDREAVTHVA